MVIRCPRAGIKSLEFTLNTEHGKRILYFIMTTTHVSFALFSGDKAKENTTDTSVLGVTTHYFLIHISPQYFSS